MADLLVLGAVKKLEKNSIAMCDGDFKNDRFLEPCFAVVTLHGGSHWGSCVYNHNLTFIGRKNYTNSYQDTPAEGGTVSTTGSDGGESWYGPAQTQSHTSSNSSSYGQLCSRLSHVGHCVVDVGPTGGISFKRWDVAAVAARNVGTWLNNSTPDTCIFSGNNYHYIGHRSHPGGVAMMTFKESLVTNRFWGNDDFSTNAKFGMISYNEKTKKLAIGESNGSYSLRFHVYSEVQPPSSFLPEKRQDFWSTTNISPTKKVITGWTDWRPTQNEGEDNYRAIVVLCDNHDIVFHRMVPHWGAYTCKFTYNSTTGQYNAFGGSTTQVSSSWTTSYGMNSGPAFGARYQISNSQKYVLAYNAGYYYGSGYQATLIRVSDGKRLHTNNHDSSHGYQFVPWRDDNFAISRDPNTDGGAMLYFNTLNAHKCMEEIADKGAFVTGGEMNYHFDSTYHSTNYPFIVPILQQNYYKFIV